jgi:hypothetical protein
LLSSRTASAVRDLQLAFAFSFGVPHPLQLKDTVFDFFRRAHSSQKVASRTTRAISSSAESKCLAA